MVDSVIMTTMNKCNDNMNELRKLQSEFGTILLSFTHLVLRNWVIYPFIDVSFDMYESDKYDSLVKLSKIRSLAVGIDKVIERLFEINDNEQKLVNGDITLSRSESDCKLRWTSSGKPIRVILSAWSVFDMIDGIRAEKIRLECMKQMQVIVGGNSLRDRTEECPSLSDIVRKSDKDSLLHPFSSLHSEFDLGIFITESRV